MSKKMKKSGLGKFVLGAAIGAGVGILFAPKKGSETRQDLKNKMDELVKKAKDIDSEDIKNKIEFTIEEIKAELADLDKEKVLAIATDKGEKIKNKCEELITLAKEKGTPVLEETAQEMKSKATKVVKEVINKLEKYDK